MTRSPRRVAIRADAAHWIGFGHVARCASLAEELRATGASIDFICRELPGNYAQWLETKGFTVHRLPPAPAPIAANSLEKPRHLGWLGVPLSQEIKESGGILQKAGPFDWLVVDHYALDETWEKSMSAFAGKIMVIDDLADRPHQCALLLDQNFYLNAEHRYDSLLPPTCQQLIGPGFALLRPEFKSLAATRSRNRSDVRRILVSFGGSDSYNATTKVLEAIADLIGDTLSVDVALGTGNRHLDAIVKRFSRIDGIRLHIQTEHMAELIAAADLAIGSCGISAWERCCLGLPSIVLITAENQRQATEDLATIGAIINLGHANEVSDHDIFNAVQALIDDRPRRTLMAGRCIEIMTPRGGNVADHMR